MGGLPCVRLLTLGNPILGKLLGRRMGRIEPIKRAQFPSG
jgi:hypothetical protein